MNLLILATEFLEIRYKKIIKYHTSLCNKIIDKNSVLCNKKQYTDFWIFDFVAARTQNLCMHVIEFLAIEFLEIRYKK
jgi:hypothetical protein